MTRYQRFWLLCMIINVAFLAADGGHNEVVRLVCIVGVFASGALFVGGDRRPPEAPVEEKF